MGAEILDLTGTDVAPLARPRRKRKADRKDNAGSSTAKTQAVVDLTQDGEDSQPAKPSKKRRQAAEADGEKRLKRFRPAPPKGEAYGGVYDRAVNQRMFCLDRSRAEDGLSETMRIAGSTGNLYTVTIGQVPSCDCPHAKKGNECKHVIFALVRVLRAPGDLYYQRAFLKSELQRIFEHAPPVTPVNAEETDGNRKAITEDDPCPICFMEFEDGQEGTVFCKTCGNNVHGECFEQWASSRRRSAAPVTCPFCRSKWLEEPGGVKLDVATASQRAPGADGYVNVAGELGISPQRDYSTYHSYWVRRQQREGRFL